MSKIYFGKFTCINLFFSLLIFTVSSSFTGCKKYITEQSPVKASEWISNADWSTARTVTLTFKENLYDIQTLSPLEFNARQPYIIKIMNPVGNLEKQYFASEISNNFFTAIAKLKAQTPALLGKSNSFIY